MARSSVVRSRSSSKKNNKLSKGASTGGASVILNNILSELRLSYDAGVGTIVGDVSSPPNLDSLSLLKKSLNLLNSQLDKTISDDENLLAKINEKLSVDAEDQRGAKRSLEEDEEVPSEKKADDDEDEDELLKPKKKRSKIKQEATETKKENKSNEEGEEEDDEDDIPLATVRKNTKGGVNTVNEHFPKIKQQDDDDEEEEEEEDNQEIAKHDDDDGNKSFDAAKNEEGEVDEENADEYHTPEGDTRVKNPKSEFVTAQTLPAALALLGLFSEETGGLDQTGEEYLKKKYAVASYPTRDLKDMLPGPIPNIDFSKSKPSNQVQFTTFQSYTDVYFRPFTEDDIKFLKEKYVLSPVLGKNYDPLLHPFLIPKLGPLYSDVWSQEESLNGIKLSTPSQAQVSADVVIPKGSADQLTDELLETDMVSCGPLVSRLLSALIPDEVDSDKVKTNDDDDESNAGNNNNDDKTTANSSSALEDQQGWNANIAKADYTQLEQRLRRELKYVGVYMNVNQTLKDRQASLAAANGVSNNSTVDSKLVKDEFQEDWISGKEDDEICAEMRLLQRELSQLTRKNNTRKKVLISIVDLNLALQEFLSILDDLQKQIDQAYIKRMRVPKKLKKRGHASQVQSATASMTPSLLAAHQLQQLQQALANSGLKSLLDKRNRWIQKIGPLFSSNELMRRMPTESIFKDVDLIKEEEDNEELDDGTGGLNAGNNNDANGGGSELISDNGN